MKEKIIFCGVMCVSVTASIICVNYTLRTAKEYRELKSDLYSRYLNISNGFDRTYYEYVKIEKRVSDLEDSMYA